MAAMMIASAVPAFAAGGGSGPRGNPDQGISNFGQGGGENIGGGGTG